MHKHFGGPVSHGGNGYAAWLNLTLTGAVKTPVDVRSTDVRHTDILCTRKAIEGVISKRTTDSQVNETKQDEEERVPSTAARSVLQATVNCIQIRSV